MILELFECGHGHYSTHEHDVCQICHQGKPEARYNEGSRPDNQETGPRTFTKYWPA